MAGMSEKNQPCAPAVWQSRLVMMAYDDITGTFLVHGNANNIVLLAYSDFRMTRISLPPPPPQQKCVK